MSEREKGEHKSVLCIFGSKIEDRVCRCVTIISLLIQYIKYKYVVKYGIRPVSEGHGGTAPFDLECNPRFQSSCGVRSTLSNLKGDSAG